MPDVRVHIFLGSIMGDSALMAHRWHTTRCDGAINRARVARAEAEARGQTERRSAGRAGVGEASVSLCPSLPGTLLPSHVTFPGLTTLSL